MVGLPDVFNDLGISVENKTKDSIPVTPVSDPVVDKKQEEKNKQKQTIIKDQFGIEKLAIPSINKAFTVNIKNNKVYVYLFGHCAQSEEYIYLNTILSVADENTEVEIHIDSPGGEVTNALHLSQALKNTKAKTTAIACGKVMSAATMIFNACRNKIINDYSLFMFHDFSTFMEGKGSLMYEKLKISNLALRENKNSLLSIQNVMLKKYLTKQEIDSFNNGIDVFIPGVLIDRRLKMGVDYV